MLFGDKHWFTAYALGAIMMTGAPALAESETATLDVSAIIPAICRISDPDLDLDLGSVTPGEKERRGKVAIDVTCPVGTPYAITLGNSEQLSLQASDKENGGTPIKIKTVIMAPDGVSDSSRLARIGTGGPDRTAMQVTAVFTGKEIAASYSQQITFTIDW